MHGAPLCAARVWRAFGPTPRHKERRRATLIASFTRLVPTPRYACSGCGIFASRQGGYGESYDKVNDEKIRKETLFRK